MLFNRSRLFVATLLAVTITFVTAEIHPLDSFDELPVPKGSDLIRMTIPGGHGAKLPLWTNEISSSSHPDHGVKSSDATDVFVILHGRERNGWEYWSIMNGIVKSAIKDNVDGASKNSIVIAPEFFTDTDENLIKSDDLAWEELNLWQEGADSIHPKGSHVSSFTVLDTFLKKYADEDKYPNVKRIVFVSHGGGAQLNTRYAVLGIDNPSPDRIQLRFVVANPSTHPYYTKDRPVDVEDDCKTVNTWRYGFGDYAKKTNYPLPGGNLKSTLARHAQRDIVYLVGLDDTQKDGLQDCAAQAQGGVHRRARTLAYWKYLNLLVGDKLNKVANYPGDFSDLKSWADDMPANLTLKAQLGAIEGVGHDDIGMLGSDVGRSAIFSQLASSGWRPKGAATNREHRDAVKSLMAKSADSVDVPKAHQHPDTSAPAAPQAPVDGEDDEEESDAELGHSTSAPSSASTLAVSVPLVLASSVLAILLA